VKHGTGVLAWAVGGALAPSLRSPQSGKFASLVTALHIGLWRIWSAAIGIAALGLRVGSRNSHVLVSIIRITVPFVDSAC